MIGISEMRHCFRFFFAIAGVLMLLSYAGCKDEGYHDHVPSSGNGSLIIDNNSGDEISVFVDGVRVAGVSGGDYQIVDLAPGFFRVVLSADHVDRSYRDDVDILQGRLTILDVKASSADNYYYYDVVTTFD